MQPIELNVVTELQPINLENAEEPIQAAITALRDLVDAYNINRPVRCNPLNIISTALTSVLGVLACFASSIIVPSYLQDMYDCDSYEPCFQDKAFGYLSSILWQYVNQNSNEQWAQNIISCRSMEPCYPPFANYLSVSCNNTEGGQSSFLFSSLLVTSKESHISIIGLCLTLFCHVLGQGVTWNMCNLLNRLPIVPPSRYLSLKRNLKVLSKHNLQLIEDIIHDMPLHKRQENHSDLYKAALRIYKIESKSYYGAATALGLLITEISLFVAAWFITIGYVSSTFESMNNNPIHYPSECIPGTYSINDGMCTYQRVQKNSYYISCESLPNPYFLDIPGGLQYFLNYPISIPGEKDILFFLSIGFFTGLFTPGIDTLLRLIYLTLKIFDRVVTNRNDP